MRENHTITRIWQSPWIASTRHIASPRQWLRRATAEGRPLPNFVIAGAQKAGTTSLFGYLSGHPQCCPSLTKEVHYFDRSYQRGESWYRSHFPQARAGKVYFESSPYYMFEPRVPLRMHKLLPHAKLIFLLRDPVSRAYSHYQHSFRRGREALSFSDAIEAEQSRLDGERERLQADPAAQSTAHRHYSYLARGLYAVQLEAWYEHYSRAQVLIVQAERMFDNPAVVFAEVLRFLELDDWLPGSFGLQNQGRYQDPMPKWVRERLAEYFSEPNERLYRLLGCRFAWQ